MLTHLEPQEPKSAKNGKSTKHRKTRDFLALPRCTGWVAGRGGGPSLLRRGENCRTAMPRPWGPLAGFMRLTPDSRAPAKADLSARAGVVVVAVAVAVVVVGVVVVVVVVVVVLVFCCCCCWPMLALFGRRFAPVLALGWPM